MTPANKTVNVAALAAVLGIVATRRRARQRAASSPDTNPLDALPLLTAELRQVAAADGVQLQVEVSGPSDATASVLLAHGYVQSSRVWDRQVAALLAARPDLRIVTYDQRGHGSSGPSPAAHCTLDQLGRDLQVILEATAPTGPVVVVGHSMGGMTLLAFAEQFPALIGPRIVGAGLVGTSAGRLTEVTYGLPKGLARLVQATLPKANESARKRELAGKKALSNAWMSRLIFGKGARPCDVRTTMAVMARCSAATVADFHATFGQHSRTAALAALRAVPVTVLVGAKDLLCPVAHSRDIAAALPDAQLFIYPGAGHMVQLERDAEVSHRLVELCDALPRPEGRRRAQSSATS